MAEHQIFPSSLVQILSAITFDRRFRCQITQFCRWLGQGVPASLNKTVGSVTVTVLHILIQTIANIVSQSPSPVVLVPDTVSVIKAHTFGSHRRTRARTKKSTETATRVAHDVLYARGIDLGNRRRGNDLDAPDHY